MKTFRQFIENLLEDKRGLTKDQSNRIQEIKRKEGSLAARQYYSLITSKKVRNIHPDKQEKTIALLRKQQTKPDLGPNRFLRFDKTLNKWVQG